MKRPSFTTQLVALWALVAALCAMLVATVWFMAMSAESQQIAGARQQAAAACEAAASRYALSRSLSGPPGNTDVMRAALDTVLAEAKGVEGGFWTAAPSRAASDQGAPPAGSGPTSNGFLAYAFPTYEGSGIKRDVPQAETPLIVRTVQVAAARGTAVTDVIRNGPEAVVAAACPVHVEPGVLAWMLTRARPPLGPHGQLLAAGLAVVLAVILVVAIVIALALRRWRRDLARLEGALSSEHASGHNVRLPRVGEPELDGIVDALNRYAARADLLRQQAGDLRDKLAGAERFSALGKLAAQVAHEIRNPAGAMRLKAENALAGDSERRESALRFILDQIGRIETQIASLLALTQPITIRPQAVNLAQWLADAIDSHDELARRRGVRLALVAKLDEPAGSPPPLPAFDADQLRRALDNLLVNALRHASEGGNVTVTVRRDDTAEPFALRIEVFDDGPGVPADQRDRIFEPFVTGRPDGSGLGLAVVREVAVAHGGRAYLDDPPNGGACFVIEVPWQPCS